MKTLIIMLFLGILRVDPAYSDEILHAEFLGNAAFRITDNDMTLFTDFPYESGTFGYMEYDPSELVLRTQAFCIFTHAHADHFAPALLGKVGCTVIGPESVLKSATSQKAIALSEKIDLPNMSIFPVKTEHGKDHFSYRVVWHGKSLYFTGDTDSIDELKQQAPMDVLFITPWLLEKAQASQALPKTSKIIIYHHRTGESVDACSQCVVPSQGQNFTF